MAKYFRQNLTPQAGVPATVPIAPLNGLLPMSRGPVEAVIRAQDKVCTYGRRIVATWGMRGSQTFFVPDDDPTVMAGTHPDPNDRRLIAAAAFDLTPGCMLRAHSVSVPSGQTQLTGTTTPGGATGTIEIELTWTDQDAGTVSTTEAITLPSSLETNGAQPTFQWTQHYIDHTTYITPGSLLDTAELRRWCRGATVQILVYAVGGARPVDGCIYETPYGMALEVDDDAEFWTSHLYGPGDPEALGGPLLYPWQRLSETTPDGDPRGGTFHLMDVHHAQHQRLGPVLFSWSGAEESSGEEGAAITSNTLVEVAGGGSTVFDVTEPGVMVGTGGYARRQSSNSEFVLRDRVAAIPVFVRIYATSIGIGSVRVMTREDSYIDISIPNGAAAWQIAYGWLEVGINPDDTASLAGQVFALAGVGGTTTIHGVVVHYAGGYSPAA